MKKTLLILSLISSSAIFGQYNTNWYYPSTSNSTKAGFIGIGTKTTTNTTNTPLPNYNLHVHGVADYISSGAVSSLGTNDNGGGDPIAVSKSSTNYGVTSRIGLTNTMTGLSDMEGAVLQMSQLDFIVRNQSAGDMLFTVPNLALRFSSSTKRLWLGNTTTSSDATLALFNVRANSTDNGLYIQTNSSLKYGVRVKVPQNTSSAIEIFGNDANTKNFTVNGGGQVFARKYTTTLDPLPDYVFFSGYDLMPLTELRSYVQTNHHLPNIPSAEELSSAPVDLGEMNRLLLEKVEELTLYVLELEDRINNLEVDK